MFRVEDEMYRQDFELENLRRTMEVLEQEKELIEKMSESEK